MDAIDQPCYANGLVHGWTQNLQTRALTRVTGYDCGKHAHVHRTT